MAPQNRCCLHLIHIGDDAGDAGQRNEEGRMAAIKELVSHSAVDKHGQAIHAICLRDIEI